MSREVKESIHKFCDASVRESNCTQARSRNCVTAVTEKLSYAVKSVTTMPRLELIEKLTVIEETQNSFFKENYDCLNLW